MEWIKISDSPYMLKHKTPWGWLVMVQDDVLIEIPGIGFESGYERRSHITFVFDPFHWWKEGR